MEMCNNLYTAMEDEAGAILMYNKLKNEMPPEHKEHIETLESIIYNEYEHLESVRNMMKEMGCKETDHRISEIERRLKEIAKEEDKLVSTISEEAEVVV